MSVEARVQKLEALLAKVKEKRRPRPELLRDERASVPIEAASPMDVISEDERPTPVPAAPTSSPRFEPTPAAASAAAPRGLANQLTPVRTPTPMEQALRSGLDLDGGGAVEDDEPELTFDDEEPQVVIGSDPDLEVVYADEPDLSFDDEPLLEEKPTAPLAGGGIRAPSEGRISDASLGAPATGRVAPEPVAPTPEPVAAPAPVKATAMPVDIPPTRASAPVAKVVSRPEPATFGALLDRSLALRPR